jgi:hypothetical protein
MELQIEGNERMTEPRIALVRQQTNKLALADRGVEREWVIEYVVLV